MPSCSFPLVLDSGITFGLIIWSRRTIPCVRESDSVRQSFTNRTLSKHRRTQTRGSPRLLHSLHNLHALRTVAALSEISTRYASGDLRQSAGTIAAISTQA